MEYVLDFFHVFMIFKQTEKFSAGSKNIHYWEREHDLMCFFLFGKNLSHDDKIEEPRRGHNDDDDDDDCLVAQLWKWKVFFYVHLFETTAKCSSYFIFLKSSSFIPIEVHSFIRSFSLSLSLRLWWWYFLVHAPVTLCAEKLQKIVCGTQAREKKHTRKF